MKQQNLKKVRALKKGTKFKFYGKDDKEFIGIAWDKRGPCRDIMIEGKEAMYSMRSDEVVEVL
jgi:hypothetical protein